MQGTTLIIDDELDICLLLASYLKKKNLKTHYALSLKEGIDKCKEFTPDVIFLDNNLPDGSGISSIKNFHEINPDCRVVIISAMTNLTEKAMAAGAVALIGKPISYQNIDMYI